MKKINNKKIITFGVILFFAVLAVILVVDKTKVSDFFISVIYDNVNHHVPCDQLLTETEILNILDKNKSEVEQIKSLGDGDGVEFNVWPLDDISLPARVGDKTSCLGKADLEIAYGSHFTREKIEAFIGQDRFHGIPYNLINQ